MGIENEKQLFKYLKDNYISDLQSTSEYDYKDATSDKYNMVIELKCRTHHYDQLIIEWSKFEKLIKNKRCRYICSTPQGIYSFNLKKMEIFWADILAPQTTFFQNNDKILKKVGYLHVDKAKKL